ncbi:MAG: hypothetical protein KJ051_08895 [Thermoleophilia bacterium]|nr:hypothetical protein [Thermoleophilia bacterium]
MSVGVFSTPRPLPDRRIPAVAGALVVALALPVFVAAGWGIDAWGLGAGLWVASQLVGALLARAGIGAPKLSGSGVVAFGMMTRGIAVMVAAIAIASYDSTLALGGALLYAAAYTVELALSLTAYYSGGAQR